MYLKTCVTPFTRSCDKPPSAPVLINFFDTIPSCPVITSDSDRGITHFFTAQEIQSREWKEKNKEQTNKRTIWAWVNSRASRLSCDTLHSLCICRLPLMCSFFAKFPQATRNADSSWRAFPHCFWTLSHADWSLLLSSVDCLSVPFPNCFLWFPLPTPLSDLPVPTSGRVEILSSGLCLVSRQNKQKDRLLGAPPS